jgi:YD repeat-containing protein
MRSFHAQPVVVSQVQTDNDPHWVKTRQRNVTASGFDVALEEEDANTASHGGEIVGWLAIAPGTGTWSGHKYEAAQTADVVSSTWAAISFAQSFASAPRFVGGIATYDGGDGSYLRYDRTSLTASGVQVMIEEDTTADEETNHTDEVVHYLAIEGSGTLTGMAVTGAPGGPGTYDRTYAYDAIGNITSKPDMGAYTYQDPLYVHAVTHIDGVQRYTYDANGNMTTRVAGGKTYIQQFTAENKLQSVTVNGQTTTFVYDGNGARVKKVDILHTGIVCAFLRLEKRSLRPRTV